jgi:hypothetical protein
MADPVPVQAVPNPEVHKNPADALTLMKRWFYYETETPNHPELKQSAQDIAEIEKLYDFYFNDEEYPADQKNGKLEASELTRRDELVKLIEKDFKLRQDLEYVMKTREQTNAGVASAYGSNLMKNFDPKRPLVVQYNPGQYFHIARSPAGQYLIHRIGPDSPIKNMAGMQYFNMQTMTLEPLVTEQRELGNILNSFRDKSFDGKKVFGEQEDKGILITLASTGQTWMVARNGVTMTYEHVRNPEAKVGKVPHYKESDETTHPKELVKPEQKPAAAEKKKEPEPHKSDIKATEQEVQYITETLKRFEKSKAPAIAYGPVYFYNADTKQCFKAQLDQNTKKITFENVAKPADDGTKTVIDYLNSDLPEKKAAPKNQKPDGTSKVSIDDELYKMIEEKGGKKLRISTENGTYAMAVNNAPGAAPERNVTYAPVVVPGNSFS